MAFWDNVWNAISNIASGIWNVLTGPVGEFILTILDPAAEIGKLSIQGAGYLLKGVEDQLSQGIISAIVMVANGIGYLNDLVKQAQADFIQALARAISDPNYGGMALLGSFISVLTLEIGYQSVKQIGWIKQVTDFIQNVYKLVTGALAFMKLDALLTLLELGGLFNDQWADALAKLYISIGALSETIGTDFSYIMAILEINRSVLYTAYSISGDAWLKSQSDYAAGVTEWAGGIKDKVGDYTVNPQHVFSDINKTIANKRSDQVDKDIASVWSAIDVAAKWIDVTGQALLDEQAHIRAEVALLPKEIQDAIAIQLAPVEARIDDFLKNKWTPFQDKYTQAQILIGQYLDNHGIRLDTLEKKITDPLSWLYALFGLVPTEQVDAMDTIVRALTTKSGTLLSAEGSLEAMSEVFPAQTPSSSAYTSLSAIENPALASTIKPAQQVITLNANPWEAIPEAQDTVPPDAQSPGNNSWYVGD